MVTWACWTWLAWIYPPETRRLRERPAGSPPDRLPLWVLALIVLTLVTAGVIVIGGRA